MVGWTLNYEAYFYVIFGLSLLFGKARWVALAGWFVFSLILLPFMAAGSVSLNPAVSYHFAFSYFNLITNPILWDFMAGILAGGLYCLKLPVALDPFWLKMASLSAVAALLYQYCSGFQGGHGILRYGGFNGLLVLVLTLLVKTNAMPRFPVILVWLGDISFSLYLVHTKAKGHYFIVTVISALILTMISYRYLEVLLTRTLHRRIWKSKSASIETQTHHAVLGGRQLKAFR